jgi:hypothetical protein
LVTASIREAVVLVREPEGGVRADGSDEPGALAIIAGLPVVSRAIEDGLARPGLGNRIGGFLRMLGRRDGHAVLTIVHLLAGGPRRAAHAEAHR